MFIELICNISIVSDYALLFLTICSGAVWYLVFLLINVPISFHVALNYLYTDQSAYKKVSFRTDVFKVVQSIRIFFKLTNFGWITRH